MPNMTSYDRGDVVLATLPFSDLTGIKQRPAVVVSAPHPSVDLLLLPLTSQLDPLQPGEFALADWKAAGLLFPSAVKRGLFTLDRTRINRRFGRVTAADQERLDGALRLWLGGHVVGSPIRRLRSSGHTLALALSGYIESDNIPSRSPANPVCCIRVFFGCGVDGIS